MSKLYELYAPKTVTPNGEEAFASDMATFDDGRSVVVWDHDGAIRMQFYDKFGEPEGDVITVASSGAEAANLAIMEDGTVIISHTSYSGESSTTSFRSWIDLKEYDSSGNFLRDTDRLDDTYSSSSLSFAPVIDVLSNGDLAIAYHFVDRNGIGSIDVVSGTLERGLFDHWTGTVDDIASFGLDFLGDLVALENGAYALARAGVNGSSNLDAFVTLEGNNGAFPDYEFRLNTFSSFEQYEPNMAVGDDGMILSVYTNAVSTDISEINARFIDPETGNSPIEFIVSGSLSSNLVNPDVTFLYDGTYLITWSDQLTGDIYARKVSSTGELLGTEMQVTMNTDAPDDLYKRNTLDTYLDQGVTMTWELDPADENIGSVHIGWYGYLPDLTLLSNGNDTAIGEKSADYVDLGDGKDNYQAGAGYDVIYGGLSADFIHGGNGWDRLFGGKGEDTLIGGRGNDELNGGAKSDFLDGGLGADMLFGMGGNDEMRGRNGADFLSGGDGDDLMSGNRGDDEMGGGDGDDNMNGGHGRDQMFGHAGNDILDGSNGADLLDGGEGDDILTGGPGKDTFKFGEGNDLITDFDVEKDKLLLDTDLINGGQNVQGFLSRAQVVGDDIVFDFGGGNTLTLEDFTDIAALSSRIDIF